MFAFLWPIRVCRYKFLPSDWTSGISFVGTFPLQHHDAIFCQMMQSKASFNRGFAIPTPVPH